MYIYTFLLRMTDTMSSKNTDISSWDTRFLRIYCNKFPLFSRNIVASIVNVPNTQKLKFKKKQIKVKIIYRKVY
jgi:hypothetical protein